MLKSVANAKRWVDKTFYPITITYRGGQICHLNN